MTIKKLEGDVPSSGFLALVTGTGKALAIKTGHTMMIVDDPERADRIIPALLVEVSRDRIVFRCNCGNPECTRVLEYRLKAKGFHPQKT